MSESVNVYEAKTHLSQLLDRAAAGEEIIIARAGRPVARLVALAEPAGQLVRHHDDPFDLMLMAQALADGLMIVTRDKRFDEYSMALMPA